MANHNKKKGQRKNNKKNKISLLSSTAAAAAAAAAAVDDSSTSGSSYYDHKNGDNDINNNNINNNNNNNNNNTRNNVSNNMSWTDPSLLRFQIGTKVECNTSKGWSLGEIIKLNYKESDWDHYVPYQIRLIDNNNNNNNNNSSSSNSSKNIEYDDERRIYAPMDCNYVIRESTLLPQWQRRRNRPCQQQIFKNDLSSSSSSSYVAIH
jgi:hypothetical protein